MTQNNIIKSLFVVVFIAFAILLFSCSPQQRLNRLLKNHPELRAKDTLIVIDTLIIKSFVYDTIFKVTNKTDTFYVTKDNVKVRIIYNGKTIETKIYLPGDTIYKKIVVPFDRVKEVIIKETYNKFYWFAAGFIAMLLLLFGIKKMT